MSWLPVFSESALLVITGTLAWVGRVEVRDTKQDKRLDSIETRLEGDDKDPSHDGVLQTLPQLETKIEDNHQELKSEHKDVQNKLERIEEKLDKVVNGETA